MQVADHFDQIKIDRASVVTIGVFDGVHRGHQALLKQLVEQAHNADQAAVVISFFPHPDVVLQGIEGRYYLTHPEEKARLLAELGVDALLLHPFNEQVRQQRAAAFVDELLAHINMTSLWATPEFALGYKREGNIAFLTEQGKEKGFTVQTIELVAGNGERISSSHIRTLLNEGQIEAAGELLGRPYRISGEVVHGEKRGRTIGFPTANLAAWEAQIIPANGVYACRAFLGDEALNAVTNIGNRPTFGGQNITIEAHILDFDRDIYGQTLSLDFIQRLRGEQKFNGFQELVAQIGKDRDRAREILLGNAG